MVLQALLGTPKVDNLNTVIRILEGGDLRCKTEMGATMLHESVRFNLPADFVRKLFELDVPIEERDFNGFTARELAIQLGKTQLVPVGVCWVKTP